VKHLSSVLHSALLGRLLGLARKNRISWKVFPGASAQAFFIIYGLKVFIILFLVSMLHIFFLASSLTLWVNKLECLF